jgi:quercetin dioxygenase-like cupin family protein
MFGIRDDFRACANSYQGEDTMIDDVTAMKKAFYRTRDMRVLGRWLLVAMLLSLAAWAQSNTPHRAPAVSITPVSHDSITIADEPELYLSTPDPEVSSAIFTFPPGAVSQWMIHPAPAYVYVLEGTLLVEFEDGSRQSFHAGQGFLQCRSKWHRGRNDGSQTMRFLAVFFGGKGVPNVVHPASGPLVDEKK